MNFSFKFRLDKRRKLDNGNYTIKVNLHSKLDGRNFDFSIKSAVSEDGSRIDFNCTESEWKNIWINKDKKNSLGEIVGENTVYGKRFEIRTALKIKHDILDELINRKDLTTHNEISKAFKNYVPKAKDSIDVYAGLKKLEEYHNKRESFEYAKGFAITSRNLKEYYGKGSIRFSDVTVGWLTQYEQMRRVSVGADAVRKDLVNVRTAYNEAKEDNIALKLKYPFGGKFGYSMPKGKSKQAGLSKVDLKKILDFSSENWYLQMARDYFLASYYLKGANMTDMIRLKKNSSSYVRKKTKSTSAVELRISDFNEEMKEIIKRHEGSGKYVFNILNDSDDENEIYRKSKAAATSVTGQLKHLVKLLDLPEKFSLQWARHSVAMHLALDKKVSLKAIQETFGHTDLKTTQGYIKTLVDDQKKEIDDALEI